jgi:hypothetical protein
MRAVAVAQRRFERHGDGRGADIGDLHAWLLARMVGRID